MMPPVATVMAILYIGLCMPSQRSIRGPNWQEWERNVNMLGQVIWLAVTIWLAAQGI